MSRSELGARFSSAVARNRQRRSEHPAKQDFERGVRVEIEHAGVTIHGRNGIEQFAARLRFPVSFRGPVQPDASGIVFVIADPVQPKKKMKRAAERLAGAPFHLLAGVFVLWHAFKAARTCQPWQSKTILGTTAP